MRFRDKLAISIAPIVLRLMIGIAFLWAGLGRVLDKQPLQAEDAAVLTQLGAVERGPGARLASAAAEGDPTVVLTGATEARLVLHDALMIYHAANPKPGSGGERPVSTWPGALAGGNAPVVIAWIGAMTAVVGGSFILLGLLTRLWGAALIGLVLVTLWLSQIGPAIQSGNTQLGVLPDRPLLDPAGGQELLWLFVLFMGALSLVLSGSGSLALDRAIFGKGGGGKHG